MSKPPVPPQRALRRRAMRQRAVRRKKGVLKAEEADDEADDEESRMAPRDGGRVIYCRGCDIWLNGLGQYNRHRRLRMHQHMLQRTRQHLKIKLESWNEENDKDEGEA